LEEKIMVGKYANCSLILKIKFAISSFSNSTVIVTPLFSIVGRFLISIVLSGTVSPFILKIHFLIHF